VNAHSIQLTKPSLASPNKFSHEANRQEIFALDKESDPILQNKEAKALLQDLLAMCKKNIADELIKEKTESDSEESFKEESSSFIVLPWSSSSFILQTPISSSLMTTTPIFSEETLKFFDTVCNQLVFLENEGISRTTLSLDSEHLRDSPFYGARILLEEFSTAPKLFNISITAGNEAISLIQTHLAGFMQLIEEKKLSFGVHRIDTDCLLDHEKDESSNEDNPNKRNS
jgi:hypothetical protein